MAATFPHLNELVEQSARGLPDVRKQRMFGCDAYFVGDSIFALIWRDGRIGVRLPDDEAYARLMATEGAEPWCVVEGKRMGCWVLVPEEFHDDDEALMPWVRAAVLQNRGGAGVAAKRAAAKKVARA